jgi:hypothetical protein
MFIPLNQFSNAHTISLAEIDALGISGMSIAEFMIEHEPDEPMPMESLDRLLRENRVGPLEVRK